ncbi:MAG: hypothetical protein P8R36_03575 [Actinomycetota bacterium]|nr:hypothetical protein [Actinomycetota bacterium]
MLKRSSQKKAPTELNRAAWTRLKPEICKEMILDAAADLVAKEGVPAGSMERLGR